MTSRWGGVGRESRGELANSKLWLVQQVHSNGTDREGKRRHTGWWGRRTVDGSLHLLSLR